MNKNIDEKILDFLNEAEKKKQKNGTETKRNKNCLIA